MASTERQIAQRLNRPNRDIASTLGTRWCFTINNFSEHELQELRTHADKIRMGIHPVMKFIVFEQEKGDETETPHLQGYFKLTGQKQRRWIMAHLEGFQRAHLEVAKGTDQQNIDYCTKDNNNVVMEGDYRQPGKGTSSKVWDDIRDMIKEGATASEIRDAYPCQYMARMSGITQWICEVYNDLHQDPWDGNLKDKNIWIWGPAGTGKSRWARTLAGQKFNKNLNKWWDGYAQQQVVILEDLDPNRCTALTQHIKIWADRYPFQAEVKGGTRPVYPDYHLVVTSNYSPEQCFPNTEDLDAITRRFHVVHFGQNPGQWEPEWPPQQQDQ